MSGAGFSHRPRIREAIIVEGRYDKNTLSQVVDALILETGGFQLFHKAEICSQIRQAAERTGVIILTDSDAAGFLIRNRIKAFIPEEKIKNAYIPDVFGKEKRKTAPGKEGKLGVEGMRPELLLQVLRQAGATIEEEEPEQSGKALRVADLYRLGLTGTPDSREKRLRLLRRLSLPEHLSTKALADALGRIGFADPHQLEKFLMEESICTAQEK